MVVVAVEEDKGLVANEDLASCDLVELVKCGHQAYLGWDLNDSSPAVRRPMKHLAPTWQIRLKE